MRVNVTLLSCTGFSPNSRSRSNTVAIFQGTNNGDFQPDDFIIDYQPVSVAGVFMSGGNGGGGGGGRRGEVRGTTASSTTVRTQE